MVGIQSSVDKTVIVMLRQAPQYCCTGCWFLAVAAARVTATPGMALHIFRGTIAFIHAVSRQQRSRSHSPKLHMHIHTFTMAFHILSRFHRLQCDTMQTEPLCKE